MFRTFFALATAISFVAPESAAACSCFFESFEQELRDADYVFEGEAVGTFPVEEPNRDRPFFVDRQSASHFTRFKISRRLKGSAAAFHDVQHELWGASCGLKFTPGERYRVFAFRSATHLSTGSCTYNELLTGEDDQSEWVETLTREALDASQSEEDRRDTIKLLNYQHEGAQSSKKKERLIDEYAELIGLLSDDSELESRYVFTRAERFFLNYDDNAALADLYTLYAEHKIQPSHLLTKAGEAHMQVFETEEAANAFRHALQFDRANRAAERGLARAELVLMGTVDPQVDDYRNLQADHVDVSGLQKRGLDLSGGSFHHLAAFRSHLRDLRLSNVKVQELNVGGARLQRANLDGIAGRTHRSQFWMNGADLRGASLVGADLNGAFLIDADLRRIDGRNANFHRAALSGARLNGAQLQGATLTSASLYNADLRGADLTDASLRGARIGCETMLPDGVTARDWQLIPFWPECDGELQNRDFSNQDWSYTDFMSLNLKGASFEGATLKNVNFDHTHLREVDFSRSTGYGSFLTANLTDASFAESRLNADFYGTSDVPYPADLTRTDFSAAEVFLGGFVSTDAEMQPNIATAVFEDATLDCPSRLDREDIERAASEIKEFESSTSVYDDGEPWFEEEELAAMRTHLNSRKRKAQNLFDMLTFITSNHDGVTLDDECQAVLDGGRVE